MKTGVSEEPLDMAEVTSVIELGTLCMSAGLPNLVSYHGGDLYNTVSAVRHEPKAQILVTDTVGFEVSVLERGISIAAILQGAVGFYSLTSPALAKAFEEILVRMKESNDDD